MLTQLSLWLTFWPNLRSPKVMCHVVISAPAVEENGLENTRAQTGFACLLSPKQRAGFPCLESVAQSRFATKAIFNLLFGRGPRLFSPTEKKETSGRYVKANYEGVWSRVNPRKMPFLPCLGSIVQESLRDFAVVLIGRREANVVANTARGGESQTSTLRHAQHPRRRKKKMQSSPVVRLYQSLCEAYRTGCAVWIRENLLS